jgi:hypothetical protein
LKVARIDWNPTYHYDPAELHFAKVNHRFDIKPGPNNPVGVVWMQLSRPTYGIHGAPHPENIGKTQSHGCVRLTNWDATQLAHAVTAGVDVVFVSGRPVTLTMARNDVAAPHAVTSKSYEPETRIPSAPIPYAALHAHESDSASPSAEPRP